MMFRRVVATLASVLVAVSAVPLWAAQCSFPDVLCHRVYLPHVKRDATPTPAVTPTPPPWPTTGDLVIEQATLFVDKNGDKRLVGKFRNNIRRWTHNLDVSIDIDLFGSGGRALGTTAGLVAIKASGWGMTSCFDSYLDDSEQGTETFRIRTSVDDFFGDVGPRVHLEPFDVSLIPVAEGSYKVVGQVRNPHTFPVEGTGMMAVTVYDGAGTAVECTEVSTDVLQPEQTQVFETNWLHEKAGHIASRVEVQGVVRPLSTSGLHLQP